MTRNEVPDWLLSAMREADAQMLAAEPYVDQMREAGRYAQQYAEQAKRAIEIGRTLLPIVRYMQAEQAWRNLTIPPALAYANQVAQAMDAGMAQLAERVARQAAPRIVTASASPAVTPTLARVAEVTEAADIEPVTTQQKAPAEADRSINVVAFAVVLVWLWALTMPAAQLLLPQEAKEYLNGLWATVGIALAVTGFMNDSRKR